MHFKNRSDAGKQLAHALQNYKGSGVLIYALPRGGVVLGAEISTALGAPLDVVLPRKIGHPKDPEYAIAAVTPYGNMVSNEAVLAEVDQKWFKEQLAAEQAEAVRRKKLYAGNKKPLSPAGKTAIIVDDGLATGLTMQAAIADIKQQKPRAIVVAVPVAPEEAVINLSSLVDDVIALTVPAGYFGGIGFYYQDFPQVTDTAVINMLRSTTRPSYVGSETAAHIGTDTFEPGLTAAPAATYPITEQEHQGVRSEKGTHPEETDQGDEENEAKLHNTPDDASSDKYGDELRHQGVPGTAVP